MPDASISREVFLRDYEVALSRGSAAAFVGAGLSVDAGFVDWRGLLRDFAGELGLDIDTEPDLVAIAQYHLNASSNDRSRLNQKIASEFSKRTTPTTAQLALAQLPLGTVWTSNYDGLLELAFGRKGSVDVKIADASLAVSDPNAVTTIYKMHGDLHDPSTVIVSRDDYERYASTHRNFQTALRAHLTSKTFLFVGFSFSDPNLAYIFSELRVSLGNNPRTHFAIIRRASPPDVTRQQLWIQDLKRYGVQVLLIDEYSEILPLLQELLARHFRRSVMVSGAYADPSPRGADALDGLSRALGAALAHDDYDVVSGFGLGIGGPVILGAVEALVRDGVLDFGTRLKLFPFPQEAPAGMTREELYTRFRENMISKAGFLVVISGNRQDGPTVVPSPGVIEEIALAEAAAKYIIPIGATGWIARDVWEKCLAEFDTRYPAGTPRKTFEALGDPASSNAELVVAAMSLIRLLTPKPA